ncbi:hypothetical protein BU15DRAFT_80991 [Melanogaster broomeanus]|nr:hypothetical protein BU15DRAFT_80991 [Melanogaster broomeanus]
MSAATNLTGTFYISSIVGTYLTFTGTNSGTNLTNLTTYQYSGGPEQQWVLAPGTASNVSSTAYTVKNVKYQTYVSYNATSGKAVGQSSSPFDWFVNIVNVSQTPSQYQFAVDPLIVSTWRDYEASASNGNPVNLHSLNSRSLSLLIAFQVVIWPCCDEVTRGYWTLASVSNTGTGMGSVGPSSALMTNSATPSPQTGSSGTSESSLNSTALIVSLSVVIPVCIVLVFIAAREWKRAKERREEKQREAEGHRSTTVMGSD